MDSAAEDLKDRKGGLDILLVRGRSQSFFLFCFVFFLFFFAYNLRNLNSCERIIVVVTSIIKVNVFFSIREVFLRK